MFCRVTVRVNVHSHSECVILSLLSFKQREHRYSDGWVQQKDDTDRCNGYISLDVLKLVSPESVNNNKNTRYEGD